MPDGLAGPERLDIFDEVRLIRPGFYLGRAYFRGSFGLNFTLIDPAVAGYDGPATDRRLHPGAVRRIAG